MAAPRTSGQRCAEEDCRAAAIDGNVCLVHIGLRYAVRFLDARLGEERPVDVANAVVPPDIADLLSQAFAGAEVHGLECEGARFTSPVDFEDVRFVGPVHCSNATFEADARFRHAKFADVADFRKARFHGEADFSEAWFDGESRFDDAQFSRNALFWDASFTDEAEFSNILFEGRLFLRPVRCGGSVNFNGSRHARPSNIGPLITEGQLDLRNATFAESPHVRAAAQRVLCDAASFERGVRMELRSGDVVLDSARFGGASTISHDLLGDDGTPPEEQKLTPPRLISMRRADVRHLSIHGLDLRPCRFTGAHGLDEIRLESGIVFNEPPPGRRWTRRQTIAEEHSLRCRIGQSAWDEEVTRRPDWLEEAYGRLPMDDSRSAGVGATYRLLRRSRENASDYSGAHDFYYGEMEMRRLWARFPSAESFVVFGYWALSGYALRASRAFTALLVVLIAATLVMWQSGFAPAPSTLEPLSVGTSGSPSYRLVAHDEPDLGGSALFVIESVLPGIRPQATALTDGGRAVRLVVAVLGPLLLGLGVISLRGQVRR